MKLLLFIFVFIVVVAPLIADDPPQGTGGAVYQEQLSVWQDQQSFDWQAAVTGLMYKSIIDSGSIKIGELVFQARRIRILQQSNAYIHDNWMEAERELQEYKSALIGLGAICLVLLCGIWALCKQKAIIIDKDRILSRISNLMKSQGK